MTHWQRELVDTGWARFPRLVPQPLVDAALQAIRADLKANFDPARQVEYDHISSCPGLRDAPPIMDLLLRSPVHGVLDELFGIGAIGWSNGQIARRAAHDMPGPVPPVPHIDGFSSGGNGVAAGAISNHTVLVGVYLTPVMREYAGNFTVWPGSHRAYEAYFRERGPQAQREPMPRPPIGEPQQLLCEPGDVVLAHYGLAHTAAVNTSDTDRIAIYFRVWLKAMENDRWGHLTHPWRGWRLGTA